MTLTIDFVQGIDAMAPGLSRAQTQLLSALRRRNEFHIRSIRIPVSSEKFLFPIVYGPLALRLRLGRADVIHIPNGWYGHLVPALRAPTIVTCHDLIEYDEVVSGSRNARPHRKFHARAAFRGMMQARFIVTDSESVARRLRRRVSPGRLKVIPLGIHSIFQPGDVRQERLAELGVKSPFVLYVGSEQPRKNLIRLVQAIALARQTHPHLSFVKVGRSQTDEGRSDLVEAIEGHGMEAQTTILEDVADVDLVDLYRAAAVTTLVSLDEGFGFPPLEAMACGCPVIVSHSGSLSEITGDAAMTVDPLDISAICAAIEKTLIDDDFTALLKKRGEVRAGLFTWEKAAKAYASLYQEAAAQP